MEEERRILAERAVKKGCGCELKGVGQREFERLASVAAADRQKLDAANQELPLPAWLVVGGWRYKLGQDEVCRGKRVGRKLRRGRGRKSGGGLCK